MPDPADAPRPVTPDTAPDTEKVPHVSAKKRRGLKPAKMELTLTSMIDVIFNLLIYFVVTANFIENEGMLLAQLPGIATAPENEPPPLTEPLQIDLREHGGNATRVQIYLNDTPLNGNFSELAAQLKGLLANQTYQATDNVEIRSTNRVRWTYVLNAYNQARRVGFDKIQLKENDQRGTG